METTQRILLADIYGYCQRNKILAKEREKNELANQIHAEENVVSEAETSIISDVKEDMPVPQPLLENEVKPGCPQLIQLETPPDITEELKVLTADYPGSSRFTVTAVLDEEPNVLQDSSSSEDDCGSITDNGLPLVDLTGSNPSADLKSTSASTNLLDQVSDVPLIDFDTLRDPLLRPNPPTLDLASVQTDLRTAGEV